MANGHTIPVEIQGQQYRIRSEGNTQLVRRAAAMVDETMTRLRQRKSAVDSLDVAVLAALNLANQFIALRDLQTGERRSREEEAEQLRSLIELVEAAVPDGTLAPH